MKCNVAVGLGGASIKFNILHAFQASLSAGGLSPATADTYYKAVVFLLNDQPLIDLKKMDIGSVVSKLQAMKYKNQYSKYKNAFIKLCDFLNLELNSNVLTSLEIMNVDKVKKHRKLKPVKLEDIKNHIRVIRDNKLRLSYMTMLSSGLRVFELCQITPKDCTITSSSIEMHFNGKGGHADTVSITDSQLVAKLTDLIHTTGEDKRLFYSANYLQTKAREMGFQCVDLRRTFAKLTYQKQKDLSKVMTQMRHTKKRSTKIYLNSKVKI